MGRGTVSGWSSAQHPPRMGLCISQPFLHLTPFSHEHTDSNEIHGEKFQSILPTNHLALEIRPRILGTHSEPPGLAFSTGSILQAHQLPARVTAASQQSLTVGIIIPIAQVNSSMLFSQVTEEPDLDMLAPNPHLAST